MPDIMRSLKAGITYFVLVFGAGFVLGLTLVPFMAPRIGEPLAELIEMPFMFVVVLPVARFIVKSDALPATPLVRLGADFLALGLFLVAKVLLVVVRGWTIRQYFASRDPVSGSVFLPVLLLFALMPLIITRTQMS